MQLELERCRNLQPAEIALVDLFFSWQLAALAGLLLHAQTRLRAMGFLEILGACQADGSVVNPCICICHSDFFLCM
jgi:hypothetical protein